MTSNKEMQEMGLKKNIEYQISLARSRNPDFVVRHPNELKAKNQDWKKEITKRVNNEESTRQALLKVRLSKRTGERRL